MSIISLEKTFENGKLVYCNIDNKIIKCICLSILYKYCVKDYDNEDLGVYECNKVKVITIYDIYKNIIYEPIRTNLFKDPIKIGGILEKLIGYIKFFKTFIGAFIKNNKLNGIEYYINYNGTLYKSLYDNIELMLNKFTKTFNIYNNEGKCIHKLEYNKKYNIYTNYDDEIIYFINNNSIEIIKGNFLFYRTIQCHIKNLKIFKIYNYYKNIKNIYEKRNDNNEIIYIMELDNKNELKEIFSSNNTNPSFSKPSRKDCIELIDYYKKNINNYNELIKSCLKKEKEIHNRLLLNYKLEMINSK